MTTSTTPALLNACRTFRSRWPAERPRAVQIALAANRAFDRGADLSQVEVLIRELQDRYLPLDG